jgi:membrane protease YdiL (CAAX protease family)
MFMHGGMGTAFFLIIFLQIVIFALIITLFVINRARFKQYYKTGLVIGIVGFVFSLPFEIMVLSMLDLEKMFQQMNLSTMRGFDFGPGFGQLFYALSIVGIVVAYLIAIGKFLFAYVIAAAEWEKIVPAPFPILMGAPNKNWNRIIIAVLIGLAAAVVSVIAAKVLKVEVNDLFQTQGNNFFKADAVSIPVQFLCSLFFVSGAAITEEVLFRGALLGFFLRLSKNRMGAMLASIFLISFVWALLHIFNTTSPAFKISQIFILGTIFAEMTRRWSLETAIAAHLSLNVTAVIMQFFITI